MEFQSRNYTSKYLAAEILKFRGKAPLKFSRKFHKIFALRQRGIYSRASGYLSWATPIKIKTQRRKRLLPGYFCSRLARTMR